MGSLEGWKDGTAEDRRGGRGGGMSRRDPVTVAQYEVLGRLGYGGPSRRDDRERFLRVVSAFLCVGRFCFS
jgi:hypothetical protein